MTPTRRWYQFSLRALLAVMALSAMALGAWLICIGPAERQRAIVRRIEDLNGVVEYANPPNDESWPIRELRKWLPRDYVDPVVSVYLKGTAGDNALGDLHELKHLETLSLEFTSVTDSGLAHISGLARLRRLDLSGTLITDAGLIRLQRLTLLEELSLHQSAVTDAGLVHIGGLPQLRRIELGGTPVTDAGFFHLRGLRELRFL